jgi:signal transduction histidine kinase
MEQHGGKVELESKVGVGTTVRIWLPLGTAGIPA